MTDRGVPCVYIGGVRYEISVAPAEELPVVTVSGPCKPIPGWTIDWITPETDLTQFPRYYPEDDND